MSDTLPIIEDGSGAKTYACTKKRYSLKIEDITTGDIFGEKFAKDAKVTVNKNLGKDWSCQQFWVASGTGGEKTINYFCLNMTSNFLDNDLIIDIKFKRFKDMCENFTYNDKNYVCDCQEDIAGIIGGDSKVKGIYLCLAKRSSN
jgi:hypothetical protein